MPDSLPADQLESLIALIQSKVRCTAPRRSSERLSDEDLVQDVLVAVLRKLPQFDPLRASLTTFVARIAESVVIDAGRRAAAAKRNPRRHSQRDDHRPLDQWGAEDRTLANRELHLDLEAALQELPPQLENLARALQHWSAAEIGDRDGAHPGTIYRRIARLRERWNDSSLREYLEP